MGEAKPRGIAVVDVGATNSKVALFDSALTLIAERKVASTHRPAPPYAQIDPAPLAAFLAEALPELDRPPHRYDRSGGAWRSAGLSCRRWQPGVAGHGLYGGAAGRTSSRPIARSSRPFRKPSGRFCRWR